jgi:hypothetical protein
LGVVQLPLEVIEAAGEALQHLPVGLDPVGEQRFHMRAPGGIIPVAPGKGDEIESLRQLAGLLQAIEGRQQLGGGEVAGRAKDDEIARRQRHFQIEHGGLLAKGRRALVMG